MSCCIHRTSVIGASLVGFLNIRFFFFFLFFFLSLPPIYFSIWPRGLSRERHLTASLPPSKAALVSPGDSETLGRKVNESLRTAARTSGGGAQVYAVSHQHQPSLNQRKDRGDDDVHGEMKIARGGFGGSGGGGVGAKNCRVHQNPQTWASCLWLT